MYLEERVEQLETQFVDHGRQIETIAKGLADLTVTVNHRFDQVNQRFDQVDQRFERVEADIVVLKQDVAELKVGQARLETAVADIQQTQQLILSILQNRFQ